MTVTRDPNVLRRATLPRWLKVATVLASVLVSTGCGDEAVQPTGDTGSGGAPVTSGGAGGSAAGGVPAAGTGGTPAATGGGGSGNLAGTGGANAGAGAGGIAGTAGTVGTAGTAGAGGADGTAGGGGTVSAGSGGGGSGGTGGSDGSGEYRPCPTDGSPCKILPLGDSITWGVGDDANGGYRRYLFEMIVNAGQKATFTGSLQNGPTMVAGQPFPRRNEGHSGWKISTPSQSSGGVAGVAALIPSPAFDESSGGRPHIILMMIGTNDANDTPADTMASHLEGLIDKITQAVPDTLLVVAKITPVPWAPSTVADYNNRIQQIVKARADSGAHVALADMNTGFNQNTMFVADNLHPNATGYMFMAQRWYDVIGQYLPK